MTKIDIMNFLQSHKEELREKYGLIKIGLFGSYAKDCATEDSDIDLYVEFKEKKFKYIAGAWNYLEEHFGKKVDLYYSHKNKRKALKDSIEQEVIYG